MKISKIAGYAGVMMKATFCPLVLKWPHKNGNAPNKHRNKLLKNGNAPNC